MFEDNARIEMNNQIEAQINAVRVGFVSLAVIDRRAVG